MILGAMVVGFFIRLVNGDSFAIALAVGLVLLVARVAIYNRRVRKRDDDEPRNRKDIGE